MVKTMSKTAQTNKKRFVAKVKAYLDDDANDEFDRDTLSRLFQSWEICMEKGDLATAQKREESCRPYIRNTHVRITLSDDDFKMIEGHAMLLHDLCNNYPNLSFPSRANRTKEGFMENLTAALVEKRKQEANS